MADPRLAARERLSKFRNRPKRWAPARNAKSTQRWYCGQLRSGCRVSSDGFVIPLRCAGRAGPDKEEKLSLDDVARMADIPRRHTAYVLSDLWEESHNSLLEF